MVKQILRNFARHYCFQHFAASAGECDGAIIAGFGRCAFFKFRCDYTSFPFVGERFKVDKGAE